MIYIVTVITLDGGVTTTRHEFYDDGRQQLELASKTGNAAMGFLAQFSDDNTIGVVLSTFGMDQKPLDNKAPMA